MPKRGAATGAAVIAALLIGVAALTALLLALATLVNGLAVTLVVAYVAYVAELGAVTLVLSPFRAVTQTGLGTVEGLLAAVAVVVWSSRGRPGPPLAGARRALNEVVHDPVTALSASVVAALLAYELALGLVAPVIRWDSLTYHLARVAAWAQHGGLYWIPNDPDPRLNSFQPLAEQQTLFLFVATGRGALSSVPQFLAELAILVAVYATARRLGFDARGAAGASLLLATFSLVVFESTTADNDLVAASLPLASACLLLGDSDLEAGLGGAAAALGLGVKLTTALVLPVLVWLALSRGRRARWPALAGGALGLVTVGMWGYVLNLVHTGHVLGAGIGPWEDRAPPGFPRSLANAFDFLYGLMDLSELSNRTIELLAFGGIGLGLAVAAVLVLRRRGEWRRAVVVAVSVAIPFLAPAVVLGSAGVLAFVARRLGFPIRGRGGVVAPLEAELGEVYTRIDNEDYAAFGPLGIVALTVSALLTLLAVVRRRADRRRLALAAAVPIFLVLISLTTAWNSDLLRFFLVPVVLTAPLLAVVFRGRATAAAYMAVAALTVTLTVIHDQARPLDNPSGPPWALTQVQAMDVDFASWLGAAVSAYEGLVPAHACVGSALGANEALYLLFGPNLEHHVDFLPLTGTLAAAYADGLFYLVVGDGPNTAIADEFQSAGWHLTPLDGYWILAVAPHPGDGACSS